MGNYATDRCTVVVYAQVGKANAGHRVQNETRLLRPKSFNLPSKVVYLGDVATHILAHLEHPETPLFTQPPKFNEQKWAFETRSGGLEVRISSEPYWGLGLFNSGYINTIQLYGSSKSCSRLLYDLVASLPRRPWEMAHTNAAGRFFAKKSDVVTSKSNELEWKKALEMADEVFQEQLFALEEQGRKVEERIRLSENSENWSQEQAAQSIGDALYDLGVARGALADGNAPGFERAMARAEAAFILADPAQAETQNRTVENDNPQGHVLSYDIEEEDVTFVDLTQNGEEE